MHVHYTHAWSTQRPAKDVRTLVIGATDSCELHVGATN